MEFKNTIFIGPPGNGKTTELQNYLDKHKDKSIYVYQEHKEVKGTYFTNITKPLGLLMSSNNLYSVIGELKTPEEFSIALKFMCVGGKLAATMTANTYNEAIEKLIENGLTIEMARGLNIKLVFVKNFFVNGAKYLSDSDYLSVAQKLLKPGDVIQFTVKGKDAVYTHYTVGTITDAYIGVGKVEDREYVELMKVNWEDFNLLERTERKWIK